MTASAITTDLKASTGVLRRVMERIGTVGQVLVPGMYAWTVTVVPIASSPTAPQIARLFAFLAIVAATVGAFAAKDQPNLGHAIGIGAFLALSLTVWVLNPHALGVGRLDPIRAIAGSLGWILFTLGWGTPWRPGVHPEDNPRAVLSPKLEPRKHRTLRAQVVVGMAIVGGLACLLLAFRASDPGRSLLMHGVAVACAVGLVSASCRISLAQGQKTKAHSPRSRLSYALPWLMALVAVLAALIAWRLSR